MRLERNPKSPESFTLPIPPANGFKCIVKFASIHSDPPGIPTETPVIAVKSFGKGKVMWSGVAFECGELYDQKNIFVNLIKEFFGFEPTVTSNAPKDVEITLHNEGSVSYVSAVLLNTDEYARHLENFDITVNCQTKPKRVKRISDGKKVKAKIKGNSVTFTASDMKIFEMYAVE